MVKRGKPKLRPGDRVRVPFGGYLVDGIVLRTDGITKASITVAMQIDPDEEMTDPLITLFEPEDVERIDAA
jgi:primosomal protein N'